MHQQICDTRHVQDFFSKHMLINQNTQYVVLHGSCSFFKANLLNQMYNNSLILWFKLAILFCYIIQSDFCNLEILFAYINFNLTNAFPHIAVICKSNWTIKHNIVKRHNCYQVILSPLLVWDKSHGLHLPIIYMI